MKHRVRFPRPYTVTRWRRTNTGIDQFGNAIYEWADTVVPAAALVTPSSEEITAAAHERRDLHHLTAYVDAGEIVHSDEVEVEGTRHRVEGIANFDRGPFEASTGLDVLYLRRVTG